MIGGEEDEVGPGEMLPFATEELFDETMDKFGDELVRLSRKCRVIQMRGIRKLMVKAEKMKDAETKVVEEQKRSEVEGEGFGGLPRNQSPDELRIAMDRLEPTEPQGSSSDFDWRATVGSKGE